MNLRPKIIFSRNEATDDQIKDGIRQEAREEGIKEVIKETIKAELGKSLTQQGQEEGVKEAAKESVKTREENVKKFQKVAESSDNILVKAKGVFPFDFFPDEVLVDANRVNIIRRFFFFSETVLSIPIANVGSVVIEAGPIFASLRVVDKDFVDNEISVGYLFKKDAEKLRRVIQALLDAYKHEVDLTKIESQNLKEKLMNIGQFKSKTLSTFDPEPTPSQK